MRSLYTVILLFCGELQAQWWQDAGLPLNQAYGVSEIYEDTTTNTLYCAGALEHVVVPGYQTFHYCTYQNGVWNRSVPFNNNVFTVINYHDTLVVGGVFTQVDGQPIQYIAAFYDGTWHSFGNMSSTVRALRFLDGELYALGAFTYADGQWCRGVAKRVNGGWENVGYLDTYQGIVGDAVIFDGKLVVSGTIFVNGEDYAHILQYDGISWESVGPGILGAIAGGGPLAVYQGDLYVAGVIPVNAGNAGHGIMRWDGSMFHPVGTGFQDYTGGQGFTLAVRGLVVKDDLLFACGGFGFAGNVPAPSQVATWDGERWCPLKGSLDPNSVAFGLGFFGDTLFVGGGQVADGQPVNRLVRFIGDTYSDTCSIPMGPMAVLDPPVSRTSTILDMGGGTYLLRGGRSGEGAPLVIHTISGQIVHVKDARFGPDGTVSFQLNGLAPATYIVGLGAFRAKLVVAAP